MSFKDIFSSDFLSNVTAISPLIALGLAVVIGLFIMMVYKKTFKGVMYSKAFGTSLLAMTIITTFIILGVTSNVVLSLGMVGALSIVRFRSAVKEPIDIAYLFWAISEGIVLGAGLIGLAVIGAILIGIIMVVCVNKDSMDNPYVLVDLVKGIDFKQIDKMALDLGMDYTNPERISNGMLLLFIS